MCWLPPNKRSLSCFDWTSHTFATFDDQHALVFFADYLVHIYAKLLPLKQPRPSPRSSSSYLHAEICAVMLVLIISYAIRTPLAAQ